MTSSRRDAAQFSTQHRDYAYDEPQDDYPQVLEKAGFPQSDVAAVEVVLNASAEDYQARQSLDYHSAQIERLEAILNDNTYNQDAVHANLASNLLDVHHAVYNVDRDVADSLLERIEHHLGESNPENIDTTMSESLAHSLAGHPGTRHLGEHIVSLSGAASEHLSEVIMRVDFQIAHHNPEGTAATYHTSEGEQSIASHYLDRTMALNGISIAYGEEPRHHREIATFRNNGSAERWNDAVNQS